MLPILISVSVTPTSLTFFCASAVVAPSANAAAAIAAILTVLLT